MADAEDDEGGDETGWDDAGSSPADRTLSDRIDEGEPTDGRWDADAEDDEPDDEESGNVAGPMFGEEETLEPGSPSMESIFFVLLGALVAGLFFLSIAGGI